MRQEASDALCRAGAAAVPALTAALTDPNNRVREEAAGVLRRIAPAAVSVSASSQSYINR